MSQLKSAEEILDNNWSPKMNLNWINREHLLAAMEEYADQFRLSPVSTDWGKLRDEFFQECVDTFPHHGAKAWLSKQKINMAPRELFEWFKKKLLSQQHSPDGASVVSLPCASGNNIEQEAYVPVSVNSEERPPKEDEQLNVGDWTYTETIESLRGENKLLKEMSSINTDLIIDLYNQINTLQQQ